MPIIACPNKITCECSDDPVRNLSAEDSDKDRHIGIYNLIILDDLQTAYQAFACKTYCYSEISQEEADDCARRAALECIGELPPPVGTSNPLSLFYNSAVTQTVSCPDGSTFSWTIGAGQFVAANQATANAIAASVAKNRAEQHRICIVSTGQGGCRDSRYSTTLQAVGGTALFFPYLNAPPSFFGCGHGEPVHYTWMVIVGALPPGLELDECTGVISGTTTATGNYTFTVRATDAIGSFQQKTLSICIIRITTNDPLPDAVKDNHYLVNLTEVPGVAETELWTIAYGSLPDGMTLTPAGVLSGTPTETGDFTIGIRVAVGTC